MTFCTGRGKGLIRWGNAVGETAGEMRVEFVPKGQFVNIREQAILRVIRMRGGAIRRIDLIKLLFLARENLAVGGGDDTDALRAIAGEYADLEGHRGQPHLRSAQNARQHGADRLRRV